MKVILLKEVKKLGHKDEVIDVSDGYAKNYLIKNNMAVPYTKTSASILNNEIKQRKNNEEILIKEMENLKKNLEKETLKFKVKVGKEDKLFGSISTKQIKNKLVDLGYDIVKKEIVIDSPITNLGFSNVKIILHKKVIASLKIEVIKE